MISVALVTLGKALEYSPLVAQMPLFALMVSFTEHLFQLLKALEDLQNLTFTNNFKCCPLFWRLPLSDPSKNDLTFTLQNNDSNSN